MNETLRITNISLLNFRETKSDANIETPTKTNSKSIQRPRVAVQVCWVYLIKILQAVVDDRRAKRESYRQEGERGLIDIMMEDEDEKDNKWRMRL
ncbi:hypothetical protein JRO89_XS01G0402200 [Xanthoceras sorbifolium]|uniref:Uncharacterized protein n=1 Tax=Xanthoceras sorbifolium TaxID=99658 RepID=A0ABQ8IQ77_9ROSI|nr:hypothetical protein JRO89_XS01G0402200 [Xanthoceras sorbifolium]